MNTVCVVTGAHATCVRGHGVRVQRPEQRIIAMTFSGNMKESKPRPGKDAWESEVCHIMFSNFSCMCRSRKFYWHAWDQWYCYGIKDFISLNYSCDSYLSVFNRNFLFNYNRCRIILLGAYRVRLNDILLTTCNRVMTLVNFNEL